MLELEGNAYCVALQKDPEKGKHWNNPSRYLLVVYLLFISDLCSIYYITKKNLLCTHSILILTSVDLNFP